MLCSKTANLRFKQRIKTECNSNIMIHSYEVTRLRDDSDIGYRINTVMSMFLHHLLQLIYDSASLIHDQPVTRYSIYLSVSILSHILTVK